MDKLYKSLRQLSLLSPSKAFKENAKRRLFNKIQSQESLWIIKLLKNILKPIPSYEFAKNTKKRLLIRAGESFSENIFSGVFEKLFNYKKTLATGVAVLFLFFAIIVPNTEAEAKNRLITQKGITEIKSRGENWRLVKNGHEESIKAGDQIKTAENSSAEIYFADNSVVRLSQNTHLGISLFSENLGKNLAEKTETVLKLQEGRIWSTVLSRGKNSLSVETKNSRVSTNFGTFDINEEDENTYVTTIQNAVSVEPRTGEEILLSAGFQTILSEQNHETQALDNFKGEWEELNQKKDIAFKSEIVEKEKEEAKDLAGILPTNPLYTVVEKIRLDGLEAVKRKFAASKVLTDLDDPEYAEKIFNEGVLELANLWTDSSKEEEKNEILAHLNFEKEFFAHVLPGDDLFPLKERFQDLFIIYANNPEQAEIEQMAGKLTEIQSLVIEKENKGFLVSSLQNFIEENERLILKNLEDADETKLEKLLSIQNNELQQLSLISQNIDDKDVLEETAKVKIALVSTIKNIVAKIAPQDIEQKSINQSQANWFADQINIMVNKVKKYETTTGQNNTVLVILKNIESKKENLPLLYALKNAMPEEVKFAISKKIMEIRRVK